MEELIKAALAIGWGFLLAFWAIWKKGEIWVIWNGKKYTGKHEEQ